MGRAEVRPRSFGLPLIDAGREGSLDVDLGKIESAGAGPNIVTQACLSDLGTFVVEDAQRPASQVATGRALDADLEPETFARRYCRRQAPDVHADRVGLG